MSVHIIYYKDGAKLMRPVKDETEYRLLRDAERNRTADKHHMVQMNYSCLPNENGALKGATRLSRSVGMDIDFDPKAPDYEAKMAQVPELVMGKKEELGLLMLERSANKGFHIVFRRRPGLSQEENLKWASRLLGVEYDKGAKDITRVFFTPPTDRLLYLDKELFDNGEAEAAASGASSSGSSSSSSGSSSSSSSGSSSSYPIIMEIKTFLLTAARGERSRVGRKALKLLPKALKHRVKLRRKAPKSLKHRLKHRLNRQPKALRRLQGRLTSAFPTR